jgi:beta-N-acetylhexosaminidase
MTSTLEISKASRGPVIVDLAGTAMTKHERNRLLDPAVGGVILFSRNFESRQQLVALCSQIHALRDPGLLIAVDHEGGRVQRFRNDGFTALPAMRKIGEQWERDPLVALRTAFAVGFVLASELRSCGVDLSFTPVLDLDFGQSAVIGDRAFHSDTRVVSVLAGRLMHGLLAADMHACGKHFPGHGYVAADSHHAIPVDQRVLSAILAQDAQPYACLSESLGAIMPAHVIYPQIDDQPAGFSRYWLQDVLRKQFRFDGVIFSDDLSMAGAAVAGDIHGRARAALQAGCDAILVCNAPDQADALLAKGVKRPSPASAARLARLRPHGPAMSWARLQKDARYCSARDLLAGL